MLVSLSPGKFSYQCLDDILSNRNVLSSFGGRESCDLGWNFSMLGQVKEKILKCNNYIINIKFGVCIFSFFEGMNTFCQGLSTANFIDNTLF